MKVKIPREIKLLTHTITVKFDPKAVYSAGTCGITKHIYKEIILDNYNLPKSELDQVFLHEYLHVVERHFAVKLDDNDIERISEGLANFLFNNLGIEFDWSDIQEKG